jgi:long-chain acyl-CoA synthetase
MKSLAEMLPKEGPKPALISGDISFSGTQMLQRISALASGLSLKKGDRVVLYSENRPEWIFAFYAVWVKGGIAVPVDAMAPPSDISRIIKDCAPSAIISSGLKISDSKKAVSLSKKKCAVVSLEKISAMPDRPLNLITAFNPEDTAILMYTSGTTGLPKGVMLSYANLEASINGVASLGMLTAEDRILGLLPFHHIFPLQGTIIAPFRIGSTVVISPGLTPPEIMGALQQHKVTLFLGVPKLYELFHAGILRKINENNVARALFKISRFINSQPLGKILFKKVHDSFGGHIHSWLTGGAPMSPQITRDMNALGFRLVEGYGLTETAPLVAFNRAGEIRNGSVGKPLAGTEVKIIDEEILVRGRNVMKGYYKNTAATAEKIRDGWFHTGDRGNFDKDGYLYVTGRLDEMIVFASGKKIYPEEIEKNILSLSPFIKDAAVYDSGGTLSCVVQPDLTRIGEEGAVSIIDTIKWKVIDRYNREVPPYRRLHGVKITTEDLPRTRLGKLKRYMLKEIVSHEDRPRPSAHKKESREYTVLRRFIEKLTERKVQPDSHFELDLALDSLNIVELIVFIESAFGVTLNETDLAKNPTPAALAEHLAAVSTGITENAGGWEDLLKDELPRVREGGILMMKLLRFVTAPVFSFRVKLLSKGTGSLPGGPFIMTPNHQSLMDVLLIARTLPDATLKNTYFIARDSLAKSAAVRWLMSKSNVIFVNIDRDLRTAIKNAAAVIQSGKNLVIFPEGHRTRDGRMSQFKKMFAILSIELKVPVVPVAINGAFELFPHGKFFPTEGTVELTYCDPVMPKEKDYEKVARKVQSMISAVLGK